MDVNIIAGVAEDSTIGDNGDIPWHYPSDLKHFKEKTTGSPVIMGRKTHESISDRLDGTLPDREHIVLSKSESELEYDPTIVDSIEASLTHAQSIVQDTEATDVWVIGGESVYREFLDCADALYLTQIPGEYDGDTKFPEIGDDWNVTKELKLCEELTVSRVEKVE